MIYLRILCEYNTMAKLNKGIVEYSENSAILTGFAKCLVSAYHYNQKHHHIMTMDLSLRYYTSYCYKSICYQSSMTC